MQPSLSSPSFQFLFHPDLGTFDLQPLDNRRPGFTGARMRLEISQTGRKRIFPLDHFEIAAGNALSHPMSSHGVQEILEVESNLPDVGLRIKVKFALSKTDPLFSWSLCLINSSPDPIKVDKIEFLRVGGQAKFGSLDFPQNNAEKKWSFYSNGWQSWSPSGAYPNGEAMRVSRLGFLQQPMIINPGTPVLRMPGYYTADFFGALADLNSKSGLVAGFLSQKQHFGSIEVVTIDRPSLALFTADGALLPPNASMETDWAVITLFSTDDSDPLGVYLDSVVREHGLENQNFKAAPAGWCSWYHYYTNLTAEDIRKNLAAIAGSQDQLPLQLVQIDDGFETHVGDWESFKPTYPDGVAPLAREISERGLLPGLWLAPFILDPRADFVRDHPEMILCNKRGKAVNAGFGWNTLATVIDLTAPGAMELALEPIHKAVREWGFSYLKLDFLYAAALQGQRFDPTRTRAQVMREGMKAIRNIAGSDTFLVGCGLPLGAGIGLVDSMRIGADTHSSWEPEMKGIRFPFRYEPAMPALRNSLHNTLTRAMLHRRWWTNDPDCLLVRKDTQLTLAEIQSSASAIGITGGSLLVSDDLTNLASERLRIGQFLLPVIGSRAEVLDLFDQPAPSRLLLSLNGPHGKWTVIAFFNWQDTPSDMEFTPTDYQLPDGPYWVSSFWDEKVFLYDPGKPLIIPSVPAHGVVLAALTPVQLDQQPLYLGSNLHFSQGAEVSHWRVEDHKVNLTLDLGHRAEGFFQLWLPSEPTVTVADGKPLKWLKITDGVYRFALKMDQAARIFVEYK